MYYYLINWNLALGKSTVGRLAAIWGPWTCLFCIRYFKSCCSTMKIVNQFSHITWHWALYICMTVVIVHSIANLAFQRHWPTPKWLCMQLKKLCLFFNLGFYAKMIPSNKRTHPRDWAWSSSHNSPHQAFLSDYYDIIPGISVTLLIYWPDVMYMYVLIDIQPIIHISNFSSESARSTSKLEINTVYEGYFLS